MLKIREKHKDYGCLRMTNELRNRGFSINKKKVQRLIKKLGIKVTAYTRKSRRYNSYRGKVGAVAKIGSIVVSTPVSAIRKSRRIQLNLNTMKWMPKALSVKRNCI